MSQGLFYGKLKHIHFVGIGGIGMSGIAEILSNLGLEVTGSDAKFSENVQRLRSLGISIEIGHSALHVQDADSVVYSSAISDDNPEIVAARALHIPVIPRAQMLAELMRFKHGIAIAGSHGKTTTTSLVACILQNAFLDPTVIIGGKVNHMGSNAALGEGDFMVAEADESDGSFLHLAPSIVAITNIDLEHLDYYKDGILSIKKAFEAFANKVPFYGLCVVCADDKNTCDILPKLDRRIITFGIEKSANIMASEIVHDGPNLGFNVEKNGSTLGFVRMRMIGKHNILNALAAIAIADELGVPFSTTQRALASFRGIARRFTHVGQVNNIKIVDDYGHHPTEIVAVLEAAKEAYPEQRLLVLFQPHRYSRTEQLAEDFNKAFKNADHVVLSNIYGAGETPIEGVNSELLAKNIRLQSQCQATFGGDLEDATDIAANLANPGDIIITLGAGDVTHSAQKIIEILSRQ